MSDRRPLLSAMVPPYAALVLDREAGEALVRRARDLEGLRQGEAARQLRVAAAQLREAARQLQEVQARAAVADDGSTAVPSGGWGADSESPPWTGVTTRVAAERLGVKERQVRNLIRDGQLSAGRGPGRAWLVAEESLAAEIERRRGVDQ